MLLEISGAYEAHTQTAKGDATAFLAYTSIYEFLPTRVGVGFPL